MSTFTQELSKEPILGEDGPTRSGEESNVCHQDDLTIWVDDVHSIHYKII